MRRDNPGDRPGHKRSRTQYLPSAQVVQELASVPDLRKLADELHSRLSDPAADARQ
jgi:hypothetical protein